MPIIPLAYITPPPHLDITPHNAKTIFIWQVLSSHRFILRGNTLPFNTLSVRYFVLSSTSWQIPLKVDKPPLFPSFINYSIREALEAFHGVIDKDRQGSIMKIALYEIILEASMLCWQRRLSGECISTAGEFS